MESETDVSAHEHALNPKQFGVGQFANGSAFGTDHPADLALGRARRLASHANRAKAQGVPAKWAPKGARMAQGGEI